MGKSLISKVQKFSKRGLYRGGARGLGGDSFLGVLFRGPTQSPGPPAKPNAMEKFGKIKKPITLVFGPGIEKVFFTPNQGPPLKDRGVWGVGPPRFFRNYFL